MNILQKLIKILASPPPKTDRAYYLYVQCNKCGEKLRSRVDVWNELTPEYDGNSDDAVSYHCRKVLIGENRCYQPIELRLKFDKNHKLIEKEISGGKYI
ncbi:MAG: hypothetical protein A2032_02630 [Chloroflexi bacterium RBG_19FT_COMBO_49_13]|nr:MAG: hypothetical protein A2032_02630 [Chloroflexi bacterium RBG_19FT_COMBO_49_13]